MGYSTELLINDEGEKANKFLTCNICLDLLEDPIECGSCENNFCKICFDEWFKNNKSCPNRCQGTNTKKPHLVLRNLLDEVKVRCFNFKLGCSETLKIKTMHSHMANSCQYSKAECPNKPCTVICMRIELPEHMKACQYQQEECKECGERVLIKEANEHNCLKEIIKKLQKQKLRMKEYKKENKELKNTIDILRAEVATNGYVHFGVKCDNCLMGPIYTDRYKCSECIDYDLCSFCYAERQKVHMRHSHFKKYGAVGVIMCSDTQLKISKETQNSISKTFLVENVSYETFKLGIVPREKEYISNFHTDIKEMIPGQRLEISIKFDINQEVEIDKLPYISFRFYAADRGEMFGSIIYLKPHIE